MGIWKTWSFNIRFSLIAFFVTAVLGLLSMGALGGLLYFPVSFLFTSYPTLNDWSGDWVWPTVIMVGMLWSFGFVFGGAAWHYLNKRTNSIVLLTLAYLVILWCWAAILWFWMIFAHIKPLSDIF